MNPVRLIPIASAEGKTSTGSSRSVAMSAAEGVDELIRSLGLSKRLRDYGIERSDFQMIAQEAGAPSQTSEIVGILEKIW